MAETTHRYWQWDEHDGRFFLSGDDGAEPIAELEPFVSADEMRANLDLIVACVNHHDAKFPASREQEDQ